MRTNADVLREALRDAAGRSDDPAVKRWLAALAERGEHAGSAQPRRLTSAGPDLLAALADIDGMTPRQLAAARRWWAAEAHAAGDWR